MRVADFEYAIKTDVRNNLIVREVDEARLQQLRRSLAIGLLLVAVLLFSAWQKVALVQHGYKLQRLQEEMAAEQAIKRRLNLQIEVLRSPENIEMLAKQLKLIPPSREEAIVIERVTPAAPPDKSVVAAR